MKLVDVSPEELQKIVCSELNIRYAQAEDGRYGAYLVALPWLLFVMTTEDAT